MGLKDFWPFRKPALEAVPDPRPAIEALGGLGGVFKQLVDRIIRMDAAQQRAQEQAGQRLEALAAEVKLAADADRRVLRALDALGEGDARRLLGELIALDVDRRRLEADLDDPTQRLEGYRLLGAQLAGVIERQEISVREGLDEPYDPQWHEALARRPGRAGHVIEVFSPAYHLADAPRPLVRAKVVVGSGDPPP